MRLTPHLQRLSDCRYKFDGWIGQYVSNITENWLTVAPKANPGLVEMMRDRDRKPLMGRWCSAGEYPGKFLTGAVEMLQLTQDEGLHHVLADLVKALVSCQESDGYLGPWPTGSHLKDQAPNSLLSKLSLGHHGPGGIWDGWGHYHLMFALMLWSEETGDRKALTCVRKMADLLCRMYLPPTHRPVEMGHPVNLSPIHALGMLYRRTGVRRYLQLAMKITEDLPGATATGRLVGNYIEDALAGRELYQTANTRWEMLHVLMGIGELYWDTGKDLYKRVLEHYWWSIVRFDRHNNGGFGSGEAAVGDPYDDRPIETCGTIAWLAMSAQMLAMTGQSIVADEMELSILNSVAGLFSPSGRWVTYNTPMDGVRELFMKNSNWHARQGTPEFSCCSANAPRGFGAISNWAILQDEGGLVLNYYGPCEMSGRLRSGLSVNLRQETDYPRRGRIALGVCPSRPARFALKLRIPYWSRRSAVRVNGQPVRGVRRGEYLRLDRLWRRGDRVDIALDMSSHFWVGRKRCQGKVSMYRGPILMTYDPRFNRSASRGAIDVATTKALAFPTDRATVSRQNATVQSAIRKGLLKPDIHVVTDRIPVLDACGATGRLVACNDWLAPMMLVQYTAANGKKVRLCDFASAGQDGGPYRSWLRIRGVTGTPFSRSNPLRSARPRKRAVAAASRRPYK